MGDFFRDHGASFIVLVLAVLGVGKLLQRQNDDRAEIKKLQGQESMTISHCKEKQDSCHLLQKAYQGGVEKDIKDLRLAFKTMKLCNDTQHSKLMDRIDKRHGEVVEHIINLNKNNGG